MQKTPKKQARKKNPTAQKTQLPPPAEAPGAQEYSTRVCVPAPMPVCCPRCRSSKTPIENGVHYNIRFGVRYEHRVCAACGFSFTASRRMTAEELDERKP